MPDDLMQELRALLARKTTPRPWTFDENGCYVWGPKGEMVADNVDEDEPPEDGEVALRVRGYGARLPQNDNGRLMAAAVNALPVLLRRIDSLEGALISATKTINRLRHVVLHTGTVLLRPGEDHVFTVTPPGPYAFKPEEIRSVNAVTCFELKFIIGTTVQYPAARVLGMSEADRKDWMAMRLDTSSGWSFDVADFEGPGEYDLASYSRPLTFFVKNVGVGLSSVGLDIVGRRMFHDDDESPDPDRQPSTGPCKGCGRSSEITG